MRQSRKIAIVAVVALVLLVRAGLSYAWFSQRAALSTLMDIIPPDSISIIPIDSETGQAMTMLDLDFNETLGDTKTDDGFVTIRRPVKIYSTSPVHQLEVVHTTNLTDLSFAIYTTTLDENGNFSDFKNSNPTPIAGEYKNETAPDSGLAKQENLINYRETDNSVEEHAYPLYWLVGNCGDPEFVAESDKSKIVVNVESKHSVDFDSAKQENKDYFSTYYYLEINWKAESKETDLFYIMAQNIAVTAVIPETGGGNA